MEIEILAATLTTLAVIFAGLNGGAFNTQDLKNTEIPNQQINQKNSILPKIPLINQLTQKPEPTNTIKAEITLPKNSEIPFKNAETTLNQKTLNNSKTTITSPSKITLQNTTGKTTLGNKTRLKAQTLQIQTNQVTIKQKTQINTKTKGQIQIKNTNKIELKYKNASIKPGKNSDFGIKTENTKLKINSYKGNMTIKPQTKIVTLNGKIDKLTAGKYTLND
jgi:hypothetical protein